MPALLVPYPQKKFQGHSPLELSVQSWAERLQGPSGLLWSAGMRAL